MQPVKVVSSMGQQSVGKSFSLNHFLDTSFAGSAMRTTGMFISPHRLPNSTERSIPEGVWMSVTPTDEALIVSLDFEGWFDATSHPYDSGHIQSTNNIVGVDSVERSLQEDTLLVLFNTAISNLVRDILPLRLPSHKQ